MPQLGCSWRSVTGQLSARVLLFHSVHSGVEYWSSGLATEPFHQLAPTTSQFKLECNNLHDLVLPWEAAHPHPVSFNPSGLLYLFVFSVVKFFSQMKCHSSGAIIHKQGWGFQTLPTRCVPLLQVLGIPWDPGHLCHA